MKQQATTETTPVGTVIDRALRDEQVTHLFTLNGGHIWPILQAAESCGIRLIDVRDERTAAFAAEGWSRVTRTCGVAAVTAGPGVTNTISAIAAARGADAPLLVLAGRAPKATWGMGALQEVDHIPMVQSLTKIARTVDDPETAAVLVRSAIRAASTPRTGPVFIDVPADVLFSAASLEQPTPETDGEPSPADPALIEQAAALMAGAKRPAAIAGSSLWWAKGEKELRSFLERSAVPVLLNGMARGMLPPDHPLFRAHARGMMLEQADVVVVIGAALDFRFSFGAGLAADAHIIYIDADSSRVHRPGAVGIFGNVRHALGLLAEAATPPREQWLAQTMTEENRGREQDKILTASNAFPIHPARLVAEAEAFCSDDAIIVGDGGDFVSFAGRLIHRRRPGLWMDAGPFGCLGSGLGYGMAAKLAFPGRQVLLLAGDGAFGYSAIDFDTLIRHRIPVVCVIGNNGIWALEKYPMEQVMGTSVAADLNPGVRYDRLVEALGGYGEMVERPEDIRPALERAFAAQAPACLDIRIDPSARYPRRASLL